ncbi:MAG: glutathione S-transferase [Rhizobiales bacterium]|nr:glutathione S-transferase [Hyphomicrobiales bacterium]
MKLYFGGLSPFVRKVMIAAHELGIRDKIETEKAMVTPFKTNNEVAAVNPLGKIPAAVLEDGTSLYGSSVICEYLDAKYGPGTLFPSDDIRWQTLRLAALGDGIREAGNLARIETLRPQGTEWEDWRIQQVGKVERALATLENDSDLLNTDKVTIAEIAVASALGWLDVRLPDLDWRPRHARLTAWFDAISERPSMIEPKPVLPK